MRRLYKTGRLFQIRLQPISPASEKPLANATKGDSRERMSVQFTKEEQEHLLQIIPELEETVRQVVLNEIQPEDAAALFARGENQFREILNAKLAARAPGASRRALEKLTGQFSHEFGERMLRATLAFFNEATGTKNIMLVREELELYLG